ncbi:PREDICTED: sodium-dependent nutrient amino acid transporter 1 isoform X2 [Nicrophorus vespilloides]|nr:PREDICTED: sodium-dependent nutrient amino acid transporter 1 isoform X2 [Nicrophorus vespilloides]
MRVVKNYNNISTDADMSECYDNLTFIKEDGDIHAKDSGNGRIVDLCNIHGDMTLSGHIYTTEDCYGTMASKSSMSNTVMSSDSGKEELGSTVKLVSPKVQKSCKSCLSLIETFLCTASVAAGIGNLYRLPQTVISNGGLPFLVAYAILLVFVGFPLLFLELGIGQIVQDGFMKTWRAVPFFKGVGYVKLLAGCLILVYYPLHMAMSLYYLIWFAKASPPFLECATVRMEKDGYKADGISGQECIQKTFLESPFEEPTWFGIYSALILLIWLIVMAWCIKRSKTYEKALIVFLLCTLACLIALIVKAIETNQFQGIEGFVTNVDWDILAKSEVWYFAAIQVFFSTHLGFGVFTSNAGVIYKKSNPFWTSLGYIFLNLVFGVLAVCLYYAVSHNIDPAPSNTTIFEIHLLTHIYDVVLQAEDADMQIWSVVAYVTIVFAGFISMITIMYTIIKALSLETKNKLRWWQLSLVLSFICFVLGCATLLCPDLDVLHIFDYYIVGNLIMITVILEVLSFMIFYGPKRLQSDFEFILGNSLTTVWLGLWYLCPLLLLGIFIWCLATMPLTGYDSDDPLWVYATGWAVVAGALVFIVIVGFYTAAQQVEYFTFGDKFVASFKPSRNWGPTDPMMLHNWMQWQSKAQDGERDFTLKRRGTKEYTHSVKNRSKYNSKSYTPTISDSSTISGTLTYKKGDQLKNYESYLRSNSYEKPLRVTSLIDVMDSTPINTFQRNSVSGGYKTNYNPLANVNNTQTVQVSYLDGHTDGSTSEGYGTYRKGPFVIEDDGLEHVCHRRSSFNEQATEL